MSTLGETYVSPQLFVDTQPNHIMTTSVKACDYEKTKNKEVPQLISTKVTQPLTNATYLPSKVAGYEQAYLISGEWQEECTYKVCGNTVAINVQFVADGVGGASFTSVIAEKNNFSAKHNIEESMTCMPDHQPYLYPKTRHISGLNNPCIYLYKSQPYDTSVAIASFSHLKNFFNCSLWPFLFS